MQGWSGHCGKSPEDIENDRYKILTPGIIRARMKDRREKDKSEKDKSEKDKSGIVRRQIAGIMQERTEWNQD